ncbi:putative monocarboxylate permease [Trichoderma afarasin]
MDLCLGTSISRYAVEESTESRQETPTEKSILPPDIGVMPWASSSTIAWIGSLQAFLLMFGAALTGTLYDAGYFRTMMYCGSFLMVFGLMMTSLANKYWQFILAQSLCTGSGIGLVALGALATPGTWFIKRRGLAIGLGSTGASIGGIIFPIALRHLIPMIGFGWAVRVMGFIVLFMLMLRLSISKQPIATQLNTDGVAPYYILTITNASSSFGRILPNYTADKIGPLNIQVPATLIAGVSVMAIAILYGPVTGVIVQSVGYDSARIYAGIMLLAGAIIMAIVRFVKTGFRLRVKA